MTLSTPTDLTQVHGKIVLVKSTHDPRNPPTAMRGWIEVHDKGEGAEVCIAVEFPQMFSTTAHHRTIPLDQAAFDRLLASERNGTFEFTIDDELV